MMRRAVRPTRFRRPAAGQSGVTFIEVLVAVVILSLGFLATSRMQILGMRYNQGAFFQSQASILAADIADRMRANLDAVDDGKFDNVSTDSLPTDPGCITDGCSSSELADNDIVQWGQSISNSLPDGLGEIQLDSGVYEISVSWSEKISDTQETQSVKIWLTP
ncbi:type IV pilus modification protein PilV [Granulosicoccaceae sp. 1_MG-2023]|nr:type IV pilus modification protein PilV [Granulosicoccaceae sp. 1_MG-2023]